MTISPIIFTAYQGGSNSSVYPASLSIPEACAHLDSLFPVFATEATPSGIPLAKPTDQEDEMTELLAWMDVFAAEATPSRTPPSSPTGREDEMTGLLARMEALTTSQIDPRIKALGTSIIQKQDLFSELLSREAKEKKDP